MGIDVWLQNYTAHLCMYLVVGQRCQVALDSVRTLLVDFSGGVQEMVRCMSIGVVHGTRESRKIAIHGKEDRWLVDEYTERDATSLENGFLRRQHMHAITTRRATLYRILSVPYHDNLKLSTNFNPTSHFAHHFLFEV